MSKRVEFRLSMPGVNSWNGRWSGEGKNYTITRKVPDDFAARLPTSWSHRWSDGWAASVSGRVMKVGEKKTKSDGFCGYEWMVDNLLRFGQTECPHPQWFSRPAPIGREDESWETCQNCRMSRRVEVPAEAGAR